MAKKKVATQKKTLASRGVAKRNYYKQSDFPLTSLQQAQKIASAIVDNFAGDGGSPPDVALALGISPTSSGWPALTGAALAYGLIDGGWNASVMRLTALGKRLVAPEAEGEDLTARREAIMKPKLLHDFFEKYRRAKFPNDVIAGNVIKAMGLPADRTSAALEIIKENGRYAGVIRETPTGPFINLDSPGVPAPTATPEFPEPNSLEAQEIGSEIQDTKRAVVPDLSSQNLLMAAKAARVFISLESKNRSLCRSKNCWLSEILNLLCQLSVRPLRFPFPRKSLRICGPAVQA
ncbi:hypothetical protein [Tardiphaga sp.]|uniref:hypothetical protein n=1 Tax=Tardiphaga sp. TaxID=1926292 RepID=UPI002635E32A|nr:hypothetical protein [Tardiphaga sp.]MDB5615951.1 hypothetical protein [Tardiphaga sp.]